MSGPRFVVPIPFWLYVVGALVVAVLWTGAVLVIGVLLLFALALYLLVAVIVWIVRAVQASSEQRKHRD